MIYNTRYDMYNILFFLQVSVMFSQKSDIQISKESFFMLFSAFFCSSYVVFVKYKNDIEEKIDVPLFFGFVGLWNLLLFWPIVLILNFSQIEVFELPNRRQFIVLLLNGIIGTVVSEALWLW